MRSSGSSTSLRARWLRDLSALVACTVALPAHAALFAGETLDKVADYVALFVLVVVPIGVILLFWMVHVLPEKIAEKRHHPQKDAIHTLCLLSLVFGGLLWPLAWLWAYTKPAAYKLAYGTEKHDDYYADFSRRANAGEISAREIALIREEIESAAARGQLTPAQRILRDELPLLHERAIDAEVAGSPPLLRAGEPEAKGVA